MNSKHAKALRQGVLYYIAETINETPEGTTPAIADIQTAAHKVAGYIIQRWDRLTHKQRGVLGLRLYDLNVAARAIAKVCHDS